MFRSKLFAVCVASFSLGIASTPVFASPAPPPPGPCDNLVISVYNDCYADYGSDSGAVATCITANYADGPCSDYWTRDPPPYNYDIIAGGVLCRFYNPTLYGICP